MTEPQQQHRCPNCDSGAVVERLEADEFMYGVATPSGPRPALLRAIVPVMSCNGCGEQWTDFRGEELRQAAVDAYLGKPPHGREL